MNAELESESTGECRALIVRLAERGIRLWSDGGRLNYVGTSAPTPEERTRLLAARDRVLEELSGEGATWPAFPCSVGQRSLWLLDQVANGQDPAYHLLTAVRLAPSVDVDLLRREIELAVARHEVLRTTYAMQFNTVWQRIHEPAPAQLSFADLGSVPEAALVRAVEEWGQRAFDLRNGPVFRAGIFARRREEGRSERVLAFCVHHIAMDFGSLQMLLGELAAALGGAAAPAPVQYRDFAARQMDWLRDTAWREQASALQERLQPLPEPLDLCNATEPPPAAGHYETSAWSATADQSASIRSTGKELGVTPFATCLALFSIVLSRLCGQRRIAVHLATTLRQGRDDMRALGNFANLTPIVLELDHASRLDDLVRAVFKASVDVLQQRAVPFPKLVELLGGERTAVRSPLTPLAFSWHRDPVELSGGNTLGEVHPLSRQLGPPGSLILTAHESDAGFDFKLTYDSRVVSRSFVRALEQGLRCASDAFATALSQPAVELPMVQAQELAERRERLAAQPGSEPVGVLARIAEIVRRSPGSVAVVAGCDELSYDALWRASLGVASHLRELGVGEGDRVAVHLRRGIQLAPAVLGVLLAGAVYVPIDAAYPSARVEYLLEISQARCVLVDAAPTFSVPSAVACCNVASIPPLTSADPALGWAPEALAYIIFTSGTTGKPKGVAIEHRSLAAFARSLAERTRIDSGSRYLSVSSISFDASIAEIFVPLVAGARLVLARDGDARNPEALAELLETHAIDVMQATPSTWKALLTAFPERRWPLLHAHSMGEALPRHVARQLKERCRSVWNLYGPTEATVYVAACAVDPDQHANLPTVPVAEPLPGCCLWVLDSALRPAARGVLGELYLSGEHLAREYWADPELTDRAFLCLPGLESNAPLRVYKTGDLARYLGDGRVEIVGRADTQVKVRGHRIELGEIEATLLQHPAVRDAIALVVRDDSDAPRIEAFIRLAEDSTEAQLNTHLRARLPGYMVPSALHVVSELVTNHNGKVDRRALLALRRPETAGAQPPIESATAARLASILGPLLARPVTDANASIFDLGADSLKAVQFKMSIRRELGREVPMGEIFERPTLRDIAGYLDGHSVARVDFQHDLKTELCIAVGESPRVTAAPRCLLLTGGTGYVGSRLLRELLAGGDASVICLVRAENDEHAARRLRAALAKIGGVPEPSWARVRALAATLGLPSFGLSDAVYASLAEGVESVVHCGALVNFSLPYASVRGNVVGTVDLARFCSRGRSKPLHFVSTYSVLDPTLERISETGELHDHSYLDFGYARSKWVCEKLLRGAVDRGLSCRIYRPSRIVSGRTGDPLNTHDFYSLVLAGSIAVGAAPRDAGMDNFVDVSGVAKRVAAAALSPFAESSVVHLCGSRWTRWQSVLNVLSQVGVELAPVDYEEWLDRVVRIAGTQPALRPFEEIEGFLRGPADRLRQCFRERHPVIEVSPFDDGAELDVEFSPELLRDHVAQLNAAFSLSSNARGLERHAVASALTPSF